MTYVVYKYISPSNKIYIGQTCRTLEQRANKGKGYSHSKYFYEAIKKYGFENFKCEILKNNLSLDEANYWEIYYINKYKSYNRNFGYNISLGGNNRQRSIEEREKISIFMKNNNPMKNPIIAQKVSQKIKGIKLSKERCKHISNGHKKQVQCIETGKIFNSRNEAAKFIGVAASGIGRAINGEQETSAGYHWRYI